MKQQHDHVVFSQETTTAAPSALLPLQDCFPNGYTKLHGYYNPAYSLYFDAVYVKFSTIIEHNKANAKFCRPHATVDYEFRIR